MSGSYELDYFNNPILKASDGTGKLSLTNKTDLSKINESKGMFTELVKNLNDYNTYVDDTKEQVITKAEYESMQLSIIELRAELSNQKAYYENQVAELISNNAKDIIDMKFQVDNANNTSQISRDLLNTFITTITDVNNDMSEILKSITTTSIISESINKLINYLPTSSWKTLTETDSVEMALIQILSYINQYEQELMKLPNPIDRTSTSFTLEFSNTEAKYLIYILEHVYDILINIKEKIQKYNYSSLKNTTNTLPDFQPYSFIELSTGSMLPLNNMTTTNDFNTWSRTINYSMSNIKLFISSNEHQNAYLESTLSYETKPYQPASLTQGVVPTQNHEFKIKIFPNVELPS